MYFNCSSDKNLAPRVGLTEVQMHANNIISLLDVSILVRFFNGCEHFKGSRSGLQKTMVSVNSLRPSGPSVQNLFALQTFRILFF